MPYNRDREEPFCEYRKRALMGKRRFSQYMEEDGDLILVNVIDAIFGHCGGCPHSVRKWCIADALGILGMDEERILQIVSGMLADCVYLDDEVQLDSFDELVEHVFVKCGQCMYNRECLAMHFMDEITPKDLILAMFYILSNCRRIRYETEREAHD